MNNSAAHSYLFFTYSRELTLPPHPAWRRQKSMHIQRISSIFQNLCLDKNPIGFINYLGISLIYVYENPLNESVSSRDTVAKQRKRIGEQSEKEQSRQTSDCKKELTGFSLKFLSIIDQKTEIKARESSGPRKNGWDMRQKIRSQASGRKQSLRRSLRVKIQKHQKSPCLAGPRVRPRDCRV